MIERILCFGHKNLTAVHKTTFELTKEKEVTKTGDCIIGVKADRGMQDFSEEFKSALKRDCAVLTIRIRMGEMEEIVTARGSKSLTLKHPTEMVVRKSDFISDRTLAIKANKAAKDFPEEFKKRMKDPSQRIEISLELD